MPDWKPSTTNAYRFTLFLTSKEGLVQYWNMERKHWILMRIYRNYFMCWLHSPGNIQLHYLRVQVHYFSSLPCLTIHRCGCTMTNTAFKPRYHLHLVLSVMVQSGRSINAPTCSTNSTKALQGTELGTAPARHGDALIASSDIHRSHCAAHTYVSRWFFLITAFQNNNTFI